MATSPASSLPEQPWTERAGLKVGAMRCSALHTPLEEWELLRYHPEAQRVLHGHLLTERGVTHGPSHPVHIHGNAREGWMGETEEGERYRDKEGAVYERTDPVSSSLS